MALPLGNTVAQPAWRRPALRGKLLVGGALLGIIVLLALFAPIVAPFPPEELHVADRFQAPNAIYLAGTDELGRDVLSRTLYGSRLSLFLGLAATFIAMLIGIPLGLLAGYSRGWLDELIMRLLDVMMSFPPIILILLVLAVMTPNLAKTALVVGLLYVPAVARLARSVTLSIAAEDFIQAARARGESRLYILFREIMPNAWPPLVVDASLRVSFAILLAAVLSFLGFGVQPPQADWGLMISQSRSFLQISPWIALTPGIVMCLTVVSLSLLGDGLREHLDPRLRHGPGL
ncbi:MAG: ABC transporter permease [Rhodospirillaceae bacterium]|nr:ABC transporter permease [Rhodospirillaceae bacterium]